jgi:hypothetical protein
MGLVAKDKGGGFDPVEAGVHHAICYGVVDLGTQFSEVYNNETHKVLIVWELPFERIVIEGKDLPRAISRRFTLSLGTKANLRGVLESWRGRSFTEKELEGFDLKNLLGANCQINVIHNTNNGKTYANVSAVMPLPKGTEKRKNENEYQYFSMEDGIEIPDNLPEWMRDVISKSSECNPKQNRIASAGVHDQTDGEELDVPF